MQKGSGGQLYSCRNFIVLLIASLFIVTASPGLAATYSATCIGMTPGDYYAEMNFNWYSSSQTNSLVQIALKADMTGSEFPESAADSFYATTGSAASGYYSNKATVGALTAGTEYVYRLGDGSGNWTGNYYVTTAPETGFSFVAVGDPQIGASSVSSDTAGWTDTVNEALTQFPDTTFIMSAGDQVETRNNESQFTGFFSPNGLRNIPVAPALGNHDNGAANTGYHFNLPNLSTQYGVTSPGSADYYFTYGNALFVILNSNNNSGASHEAFISEAVNANPDVEWKIAMFHHDIYGSAYHALETYVMNLRAALFPVFDEYGFDVVMTGHDHSYSRSHVLYGDVPQEDQTYDENGAVVDPTGTVYFTLNSASGSKYYSLNSSQATYCAFRSQIYEPTFSYVTINGNTLTVDTYRTDTMGAIDTFSIVKTGGSSPVPVTGVELDYGEMILEVGETATLTATILPANATNTSVTWTTSDSGVATVSNGLVTAVSAGEATIAVTTADGGYTDTCVVTAIGEGTTGEATAQVSGSMDDVEELISDGSMYTNSSDLELIYDDYAGGDQMVGLRFTGLAIPQGATITTAHIQFTCDETDSGTTNLTISAQAADNAEAFTTSNFDVSDRVTTSASVNWSVAAWDTVGEAGTDQQTPDLSSIIQEVVDRSGWNSGNAMVIVVTGSGSRTAEAYDGDSASAALLHVEYVIGDIVNAAPVWDSNPVVEAGATEDAAYNSTLEDDANDDDGDPLTFAKVSGPAWLSVAADGALSGTPSNSDVGVNSWTVSVSDGIDSPVETTLNIAVANTNDAPTFTADPITEPDAERDVAYSGSIAGTATDIDAGETLTYGKVSGPAWLSVATDGALSGTPSSSDIGANSWAVQVSDGNGGSDTATLEITVTDDPVSGWTQVISDDFEGGFGNWVDGGSDCILYTGGFRASQGSNAINIQDNTSTSVVSTNNLALSGYSQVKVDFSYYPYSMDNTREDFWLQISTDGGSSYTTVEEWNKGDEFENNSFYSDSVIITGYTLTDQTRIRFRCDASGNRDDIYLDEIVVSVQ